MAISTLTEMGTGWIRPNLLFADYSGIGGSLIDAIAGNSSMSPIRGDVHWIVIVNREFCRDGSADPCRHLGTDRFLDERLGDFA
jgi:hypothetical protein